MDFNRKKKENKKNFNVNVNLNLNFLTYMFWQKLLPSSGLIGTLSNEDGDADDDGKEQ